MTSNFWASKLAEAVKPDRQLSPPPAIKQAPAQPEIEDADDPQGLSAEEWLEGTAQYKRPDGSTFSVPRRDDSAIFVRQGHHSWETNNRVIRADAGIFGDASPRQTAAAARRAARDHSHTGNTPWTRAQMVSDGIKSGEYTDAGHGDGGAFDQTSAVRTGWTPLYRG